MGKQNIEGGQAAPLRTVGYLLGASTLVLHHEVRGKSVGLNPWDLRWWRGEGLATTITGILADLGRLSLYLQIPSCFPNEQLCSPIEETCGYTLTGGLQGVQICLIRILKGGVLLALEPRLPLPVQGAKSQPPPPPCGGECLLAPSNQQGWRQCLQSVHSGSTWAKRWVSRADSLLSKASGSVQSRDLECGLAWVRVKTTNKNLYWL